MDAQSVIHQIQGAALISLPFLALIANLIPGIPEELFVIAVGYVSATGVLPVWLAFVLVVPALMLSDNALYWLSRQGNKQVQFVARKIFGNLIEEKLKMSQGSQDALLFISRFIFQARFLGPFICGMSKMNYRRFFVIDTIAVSLYVAMMYAVGFFLRAQYRNINEGAGAVMEIIGTLAVILIIVTVVYVMRKKLIAWLKTLLGGGFSILGIEYNPKEVKTDTDAQ
jgi:membrane-associated protein